MQLHVKADSSISLVVEKGRVKGITQAIELPKSIAAPIKKDQPVGEVRILSGDETLARFMLTAASNVEELTLMRGFTRLFCDLTRI